MDNYIGKRLDGRYEIRELIGVGGMANVYKAYDIAEQRVVAVKILRDEYMNNDEFIRRFRNESRAISLLSHPNIVKVYDVIFSDRIQSIVMEYIDGITLKDYIDQEGTLRWKEAVHFTVQILRALQHAHDRGIVHRDIKPQNIMLLSDGTIKITDFGIARFSRSNTKTITDRAIGSVHYISPEQASGAPTDARTDIYSLGVMMFEMLTGKLPFEADSPVSVAIKQIQSQPLRPRSLNPSIPVGLEEITMRAMQKDATQRYQSAAEMLRDIEAFKQDPSVVFEYKYLTEQPVAQEIGQTVQPREEAMQKASPGRRTRAAQTKEEAAEPYERKPLPVIPVLAGIAFAFLLAAGAFITMLFIVNKPFAEVPTVTTPDLVGMTYEKVKTLYSGSDADVVLEVVDEVASSDYEEGKICSQSPNAGKRVKQGTTVKLTISTGQETVTLSDYSNQDSTTVFRDLSDKKLKYVDQSTYSNTVAKGNVVKTAPAAGETVVAGDTVTVFVSLGPQQTDVTVPLIEGLNFHEGKSLLTTSKLRIEAIEELDEDDPEARGKQPGTIVSQSPSADSKVPSGSVVSVVVVGGDNWQDPNQKRQVEITFDLPEDREEEIYIETELDGVVVKNGKPSSRQETWTTRPEGRGEGKVRILLNGEVYRTYDVNFDSGTVVETTGMETDESVNLATQKDQESLQQGAGISSGTQDDEEDDFWTEVSPDE